MRSLCKLVRGSIGIAVLVVGFSTGAWGQVPTPPVAPFANLNALTRIKGAVVCVGCSLEEVEQAHAASGPLYELDSSQSKSKAVLRVDWVDDAARWESISMGRHLWVRAAAPVWQQLTSEVNLFKKVEITGLLSSTRTLDVGQVTVIE